jgi:hypothetical protein
MFATRSLTSFGPEYSPKMAAAIASCTGAIARLDARFSNSSVASAWSRRAAWSGYAKALQLQSAEIDEIDVFSWGCGLQIAGRPIRATNVDLFDRFGEWEAALRCDDPLSWRDGLPTAIGEPANAGDHPALVRAFDCVRQHARIDGGALPWLGLPFALRDFALAAAPLPCLVGGVKAFRLKRMPDDGDWSAALRALEMSALAGLERLDALERLYRDAQRAIIAEYRPGTLPALFAFAQHQPLMSPQSVSSKLDLSLAGASKLLERAAGAGLVLEITKRRSWRQFLTVDLAVEFGFAVPRRGRPAKEAAPLPASRDLAAVFDAFDEEMSRIDRLLNKAE